MFKFYNWLSPPLLNKIFQLKAENSYNLRQFSSLKVKSVYHGTEDQKISYLGPKIRDILPKNLKNIDNLEHFKKEIKIWKTHCPCTLCKVYIESLEFLYFL